MFAFSTIERDQFDLFHWSKLGKNTKMLHVREKSDKSKYQQDVNRQKSAHL